MQVVLVMFRADGQRRSFSVVRETTIIGRGEDCDLRIPLGEVSRKHCRLIKDDSAVRVEDLGSSNGTFHNEQRVQEAGLNPGDTIRVGPVTFMVQIDGVPSDEEMQPAAAPEQSGEGRHVDPVHAAGDGVSDSASDDLSVFLSDDSGADGKRSGRADPKDDSDKLDLPLDLASESGGEDLLELKEHSDRPS